MKFGPLPLEEVAGTILAHSVSVAGKRWRKGLVLSAGDVETLAAAGVNELIVARLDADDLDEDAAAARLATAIVPDPEKAGLQVTNAFTGRVNLIAEGPGVLQIDVAAIEAFNRVHPMITIATVPQWQQMAKGQMAATIKIISYAVPLSDVERAERLVRHALVLQKPSMRDAALVVTDIPGGPSNEKGVAAIRGRIEALGMVLSETRIVPHETEALSDAVVQVHGDMVMILTGSATSDVDDVAPSAVRRAGGQVDRFGMPVDPGNLLFLGSLQNRPVIGLPGCARSPTLNGADWVLSRVACGIAVSSDDISGMGVGGLLKEIPTRPQPRAGRRPTK